MANELKLTAETDGILWSVRVNGEVFLVVRNRLIDWSGFDVHAVSDGGIEYLGDAPTHNEALTLIRAEIGD